MMRGLKVAYDVLTGALALVAFIFMIAILLSMSGCSSAPIAPECPVAPKCPPAYSRMSPDEVKFMEGAREVTAEMEAFNRKMRKGR